MGIFGALGGLGTLGGAIAGIVSGTVSGGNKGSGGSSRPSSGGNSGGGYGGSSGGTSGNSGGNKYTENIYSDQGTLSQGELNQIQGYREQAKAGQITWDQANSAANAIRGQYGYSVDKAGNVTDYTSHLTQQQPGAVNTAGSMGSRSTICPALTSICSSQGMTSTARPPARPFSQRWIRR